MSKKKIQKWAICGGVLIVGIAFITLLEEPNLSPIVVGIAVGCSFMISTEENNNDRQKK